mmetsp:Transcript_21582/g.45057  ORF Transcript_21582/g.45057 Transcript_21582/m.45057 type:complete len:98 (-) Transcript_21582:38-331(-)
MRKKCGQWTESAMAPSVLSIQVVSLWLSSACFDHICTFELCFFLGSFEIFFVDFPLTFFCTCEIGSSYGNECLDQLAWRQSILRLPLLKNANRRDAF